MGIIVTSDIYKILFEKVEAFGIKSVYDGWNPITSPLKEEAVVIVTDMPIEPDVYWEDTTVHVNICVPDYLEKENTVRLNELERAANQWIRDGFTEMYDNTRYDISKSSLGKERDDALKCSYVNLKLVFKILNVR